MKRRLGILCWLVVTGLVLAGVLLIFMPPARNSAGMKSVAETRQALREQGFKTDLADFDFSTSPEMRAREAILKAPGQDDRFPALVSHPKLMETIGNESAVVVWQQNSLPGLFPSHENPSGDLSWDEFRNLVNTNQAQLDAAVDMLLSGPVRFNLDSSRGDGLLLPHLADVKRLAQFLGSRIVLNLHDGHSDAAWTNLLAVTRLVAAWKPEPVEAACLVRFAAASIAYGATWQALRSHHWADDKLSRLQAEWESVDYLTNLSDVTAYTRASAAAACELERRRSIRDDYTFLEFCRLVMRYPAAAFSQLTHHARDRAYRQNGSYDDEKDLLLFYRDREVEVRNAIQAATWSEMRTLPGVTNEPFFRSPHSSLMQAKMQVRRAGLGGMNQGSTLLRRAAESEARRRILITAIALERYYSRNKSYPQSLADLTPEFLKAPLPDFMDGQPLRYRRTEDGHFILHSVGLDCVDNGGRILNREERRSAQQELGTTGIMPEDIVWPRPTTAEDRQEEEQRQSKARELASRRFLNEISDREWTASLARQSRVTNILAMNWSVGSEVPTFKGQRIESLVGNVKASDTNQLTLAALLTPRQIVTGREPEDITFEFPIRYDTITNQNSLFVMVDADPEEEFKLDRGGSVYDLERAANGDCLVVWHAIYDPPGQHAVQAYLILDDKREGVLHMWGPPLAVTTSNLCQFSLDCANYDVARGARFHARLPESNGLYSIECLTTNGAHLATLTGSTTNGEFNVVWNLVDDKGYRLTGEKFNSIVRITLPDSGRTQTLRGP